MADPTPQQMMRHVTATITHLGDTFKVHGKLGVLTHFGLVPDALNADMSQTGGSKSVARRSYRRSRWLGDTVKSPVAASTARRLWYPSRRGTALGGVPIWLEDLEAEEKWQVMLDGPIGLLASYLLAHRPKVDTQLYGKTGNRFRAPILKTAPAGGGGTQSATVAQVGGSQAP